MGIRGFHVYKEIWYTYVQQQISFTEEPENIYDDFAVAGYATLPSSGSADPEIVGHVPRELSRYFYYAMQSGATFTARVYSARHRPLPLMQGGLEIPLVVDVEWDDTSKLDIFRACVDKMGYNVDTSYSDEATEILKEILPPDLQVDENGDYSDVDDDDDAII